MIFRLFTVLYFSAVLTFITAGNAGALRLGTLQAHPFIDFKTVYDDNVFVQNSDRVGDWYFQISPGLLFQLPHGDNMYQLEYKADIYRFVDTGDINDTVNHSLKASTDVKFPGGLYLKVKDLAVSAHETRSESNLAVAGTSLVSYLSNGFDAEVGYEVSPRFKASLSYQNYVVSFAPASESFRDRVDEGVGATVYYKFMPKTSLLMQGIYKNVHHGQNTAEARFLDSDEYWAMAGITGKLTSKTTGTVKAGYEWKRFDQAGRGNFESPIYEVTVEHKFTSKTSLKITGLRQAKETDDPNVSYYTTTTGALEATFNPIRRLGIRPYGSIASNRYSGVTTVLGDTARRLDLVWLGGIDVGYEMNKWLKITAGYLHTKRTSTIAFYDYTDNTVILGFKASL